MTIADLSADADVVVASYALFRLELPCYRKVSWAKLDLLVQLVDDVVAEGHRVLVFSQFTRFLRTARDRIDAAGHDVCYLDGRTRRRDDVVEQFRSGTAPVFLISLKAAKAGLTASTLDDADLASADLTVDDLRRLIG